MFFFVRSKMMSRRGLIACLLLGCLLASAVICSIPMYTDAMLQRLLVRDLAGYEQNYHVNPARLTLTHNLEYQTETGYDLYLGERDWLDTEDFDELGMDLWDRTCVLTMNGLRFKNVNAESRRFTPVSVYSLTGVEKWIKVTAGRLPEPGLREDGCYEILIQANTQKHLGVALGETYIIQDYARILKGDNRVRIVGIFEQADGANLWNFANYEDYFLMDAETMRNDFIDRCRKVTSVSWIYHLDYTSLKVDGIAATGEALTDLTETFCVPFEKLLDFPAEEVIRTFITREKQLRIMLWGLNVPVLVMLGLYLFMVAQLIVQADSGELSVLSSRGAGRMQLFRIYWLQSLFLCGISLAAGPFLAWLFCRMLGAVPGFCDLADRVGLPIELAPRVWIYAGAAFLFTMTFLLLPVFRAAGRSVVEKKQENAARYEKPLWQKFFLDFACLAAALYGLYSYGLRQEGVEAVASSNPLDVPVDPILFLISTLFVLGAALVFIRLYPYVVRLFFTIGRRIWNAPVYSAMLTTVRSGSRERFLMLFLAFTLAIGVYSGTTAATLNLNTMRHVRQETPVDAQIMLHWPSPIAINGISPFDLAKGGTGYVEPSFERVLSMDGVTDAARVLLREDAYSRAKTSPNAPKLHDLKGAVMVFYPEEFADVVHPVAGVLHYPVSDYLALMQENASGVIVSENYRNTYGLAEGDVISYRVVEDTMEGKRSWGWVDGTIMAFVPSWPGLDPSDPHQEYFIISNYHYWDLFTLTMPYSYWLSLKEGVDSAELLREAEEDPYLTIESFTYPVTYEEEMKSAAEDPLLQGVNGGLTLGFLVTMGITVIGFLLYWFMVVQSRELQFGILRAMGLTRAELMGTLLTEQILLCAVSIVAGLVIGGIAGKLYVPLLQLGSDTLSQNPPFMVFSRRTDYVRLYRWIGGLFAGGIVMLILLLRRMNVTHALKLGED